MDWLNWFGVQVEWKCANDDRLLRFMAVLVVGCCWAICNKSNICVFEIRKFENLVTHSNFDVWNMDFELFYENIGSRIKNVTIAKTFFGIGDWFGGTYPE